MIVFPREGNTALIARGSLILINVVQGENPSDAEASIISLFYRLKSSSNYFTSVSPSIDTKG